MKRCSFFCAGLWPFILLPLLLLLPLLFFSWHSIEEKVAANTSDALRVIKADWANVETFNRGRNVLLTGTAPSQDAVDKALSIANDAPGVRSATFHQAEDNIAAPAAPAFNLSAKEGVVTLTGTLASEYVINKVVRNAQTLYGSDKVINELKLGENTADVPDVSGFFSIFNDLGLSDNYAAELFQNELTLMGVVASDETKTRISQEIAKTFDGNIKNRLSVLPAAPAPKAVEEEAPMLAPAKIEQVACEQQLKNLLTSEKINFQTAKDTIDQSSSSLLDKIAAITMRCPEAQFEVAGHTDSAGRLELNMNLSQARAQSVINYVVDLGLDANQFEAKGYGPNQPIADNATADGRAANRRIEFKLKNQQN